MPIPTQDRQPWGCGRRRLGQAFLPGQRHTAYYINSGISSPCGEKGGARAGARESKEILGDARNWGIPRGKFSPSKKARCWDALWSGWFWPLASSWLCPRFFGLGMKATGGGLKRGKRKNLHVESTRPYGRDLKQQESAGWHKDSSRDKEGGRGWGARSCFWGVPRFPQYGK